MSCSNCSCNAKILICNPSIFLFSLFSWKSLGSWIIGIQNKVASLKWKLSHINNHSIDWSFLTKLSMETFFTALNIIKRPPHAIHNQFCWIDNSVINLNHIINIWHRHSHIGPLVLCDSPINENIIIYLHRFKINGCE